MSVFMRYYVAIICVAFLVSSILIPGISAQDQCVTEFNTDMTVETASLFSIQYVNNYKLVTNKKSNEIFVLYQCGSPVPTDIPTGAKLFQVPIKNVAVTDTSVIPFLELLGYRSAIKLLGSSDLISSPCLQLAKDSNEVTILTNNQTLNDIELQGVDLSFDSEAKPTDLKSVSGAPSSDPGVLNRVEWIKFYSVFFNGEAKANEVYGKIKSNYECFKNFANNNLQESKPIVAWVSYDAPSEFNQNIASWKIVDAVFKKQLTEDAGGSYFNITPLSFDTSTDFLKAIENVDILIDESFIGSSIDDVYNNFGIVEADKQKYKFVKNQAIYREDGTTNPNDGRDWFENAIAMGDASLEDMINVINPKLPKPDYNRIWLRNVAKDEPVKISSSANCTDPNNPLVSKADDCASIAKTSAKGTGAISSTPTFISCFISFVFVDIAMLFL